MMIVQFNKISPEHRTLVRSIETKAYASYIRYLLLKRWPFDRVRRELMRLGLAWNEKEDLQIYFKEVLYPIIQKYKLTKYYRVYKSNMAEEPLVFSTTFGKSERDRVAFVDLLKYIEADHFFAEEIVNHYGGVSNIPDHPVTGDPIIPREKPTDIIEVLRNPQRHLIESMLVEGYTAEQITDYLYQRYDMEVKPVEVKVYAKSFFNIKRQDIQRLLDTLQTEKTELENHLLEIKKRSPNDFSFGERFEIISMISGKIDELTTMIKKLSSTHTNTAFNSAVLEISDIREMFKDVMVRSHRRFRDMDERTEDEVVNSLDKIVSMMSKATDKIIGVEDILNRKTNKSINEEMLEVIMPTLDRIEQEEREAMYSYKTSQDDDEEDDDAIIGFED